jgi:hypothetical protein
MEYTQLLEQFTAVWLSVFPSLLALHTRSGAITIQRIDCLWRFEFHQQTN